MYTEFYSLTGRPFQLTPDPRFYFDSSTHKKAMAYLTYGLSQEEGFIIITGDIGSGKTTLVGHLFDELDKEQYVAAKVVTTQLGADDVLRMVAASFGLKTEGADKATILQNIEQFLQMNAKKGKRVVLIIDEVQNLHTAALEELRMLSNFQQGDRALLQSFLLGQPEFRDKWAHDPELEQLRQRVIATHHLQPMTLPETKEYIEHRLSLVGWKDDPLFTEDAYEEIFKFTDGVPRRLNTLCSRLLLFGAIEELHEINGAAVKDVVIDLEKDNAAAASSEMKNAPEAEVTRIRRENGQSAEKTPVLDSESLEDLKARLQLLEQYVKVHDDTIKNALDIASDWLKQNSSEKS
ncbi:MAG: ATPase [Kordiimonas sp.]|nr:ATPase [Kordiimonas sp.]|tara:strand:+ start:2746 stop:3795 length:1050 start_codon:yes stop_codon:yes gene_type:complete